MNKLFVFCWILAFVGVALIYIVPWIVSLVKKAETSEITQYIIKGIGVICSVAGMLTLFVKGGFN